MKRLLNPILVVFVLLLSVNVKGATYYVNDASTSGDIFTTAVGNNGNSGLTPALPKLTLANAISVASNGDTIKIDKGTYNEVSLTINKELTIIGAGTGYTIFTGSASVNRFATISADNVTIQNLTVRNYYLNADGQVITMTGRTGILFKNIVVKDNQGSATAGVNFLLTNSNVTFSGCLFSCSGWNADGGGTIKADNSTLLVEYCLFKEVRNFATSGNGGAIELSGATPNVTVLNTSFNKCSARRGGAIYQGGTGVSSLTVTGSCFTDNFSAGDASDPLNGGGAFYNKAIAGSSSVFTNCTFTNNKVNKDGDANASSDGGAILYRGAAGSFSFDKCSFDNISTSSYDKGQDFYLDEGTGLTGSITNCTFGASTNANGGSKVNIYNFDLEASDVNVTNSNTWTFTGTAFTTIDALAPVWDATFSAPNTNCIDPNNIAACGVAIDCNTELISPIIIKCVDDKTITDCSVLPDYTPEVSAYDDCSFTVSQSPVPGTVLGNGSYTVTMTVNDGHSTPVTCTFTVTVSGCVGCVDPGPPTGSASQTFCSIANPTIVNLVATGTAVQWYAASSGGAALASGTALVDNTHYFASQTVGGCESAVRLDVTVTITDPAAPIGSASQTFCSIDNKTVVDLVVVGSSIIWYDAAVAGSVVPGATSLVNGTTYYATQTTGGCESDTRLAVTVTITDPAAPTGSGTQTFCSIDNKTVADLVVVGSSVIWYDAAIAGSVVPGATALVNGATYYATQTTSGCESDTRLAVTVTITDPAAPTGSATQTFCSIDNKTVADLVVIGTSVIWYDAAVAGSVVPGATSLVNGATYYATQTTSGCESDTRLAVTVTITDPAAPTGIALQNFCTNDNPTVANLAVIGTNIQWYDATSSGNQLASSDLLIDGFQYFATQTLSGCESTLRFSVVVNLDELNLTLVSLNQPTCGQENGSVTVLASNGIGTYSYSWSNGSSESTVSNIGIGQYTVEVTDSLGCSNQLDVVIDCISIIPEIITPNGNGKNETWILGLDAKAKVQIFNRWGNLVYSASPYLDDWNGKANEGTTIGNEFLPSATYFYVIDLNNGEKPLSGYLELIR